MAICQKTQEIDIAISCFGYTSILKHHAPSICEHGRTKGASWACTFPSMEWDNSNPANSSVVWRHNHKWKDLDPGCHASNTTLSRTDTTLFNIRIERSWQKFIPSLISSTFPALFAILNILPACRFHGQRGHNNLFYTQRTSPKRSVIKICDEGNKLVLKKYS